MDFDNINELKETLNEFHQLLILGVEADDEYTSEADEMLKMVERVQKKLEDVDSAEQIKLLIGDFGWDMLHIFMCVQDISNMDDIEDDFEVDFDPEAFKLASKK